MAQTLPPLTAEQLLLMALIEAQKPKVRAAIRDQLQTWRTWHNIRSMRLGSRDGEELGRAADEAMTQLDRIGRNRP